MKNKSPDEKAKKLAKKNSSAITGNATFEDYKPYIKEMRSSFWKVLALFGFGAIVGMSYYKQILTFIMSFFELDNINVVLTSPYQFIDLSINSGFFIGVVFAMPVFLYYSLQFSKPALKDVEYKLLLKMIPASVVLFITGFIFGVWVLQYVVDLFSQTSANLEIGNIWDLSAFLAQVIIMGLSLAMIFQMPIVITSLLKLKIIKYNALLKQRRTVYAVIVVFAALMPPTDIVALLILAIVPLFLFEITLFLNKITQ